MKNRLSFSLQILLATAFVSLAFLAFATPLAAQISWQRQAYGQVHYPPGHEGDPAFAFNYPNNNNWSQTVTFAVDGDGNPLYQTAPSNWSVSGYPTNGGAVTLGDEGLGGNNAPTNLDRGVETAGTSGAIVLNSLNIEVDGGLNMEFGTSLIAVLYNFEGNNLDEAGITVGGGGGASPVIALATNGTLRKASGNRSFTLHEQIKLLVNDAGTIACDAGQLLLPGAASRYASSVNGTVNFDAANGAFIELAPASAFDSATVRFTGSITGTNTGGTVRHRQGWIGPLVGGGGTTFDFGGDTFQFQGGWIVSTAEDPFVNAGTINVTFSTPILVGVGFINQGTVIQSDTGALSMAFSSAFTNTATGLFEMRNDSGLHLGGGGGAAPVFHNSGMIRKSAGTETATIDPTITIDNNGGTIQVDTGTLELPGQQSRYTDATFNVGSGAVLALAPANAGNGSVLFAGTITGTDTGGTVLHNRGWISTATNGGGATFNLPGDTFQVQGGWVTSTTADPFINAGTMNVTVGNPILVGQGFSNQGIIIQSGTGGLSFAFSSSFTNAANGLFDIQNDTGLYLGGGGGGYPIFTNEGTFQKSISSGSALIDTTFNNAGTVLASSGTLNFRHIIQTDGVIDLNGGDLSTVEEMTLNGGSLAGSGTITGLVRNNSGTVAPGHSPGTIAISGNYIQGADGTLNLEIGGRTAGTEYDQLAVSGNANLNGTLNVTLINGFRPHVGDIFQIITNGNFGGAFSAIHTIGFTGQVEYNAGAITIMVLTVPDIPLNIATRMRVKPDPSQLIGGLIVTGTQPKRVLIRAIGPSLGAFLSDALANPTLELFEGSTLLESNDNWKDNNQAAIEATGIPPTNDLESAIVRTLAPGAYTAIMRGVGGGVSGIGLVEAYDLDLEASAKLANIATRGFVDTDDNVMIGGFIMGGNGGANGRVVIRAIGPSLANFGIEGALGDPVLELHDANGSTLQSNDDWQSSQQAEIEATGLAPTDMHESVIVTSLLSGNYTAIVRGKNNTTGVGLVEVYNID